MALATLTKTTKTKPPHGVCQVCWLLNQLPDNTAAVLTDALSHPNITYRQIADDEDIAPWGIHKDALRRHATGQCSAKVNLRPKVI